MSNIASHLRPWAKNQRFMACLRCINDVKSETIVEKNVKRTILLRFIKKTSKIYFYEIAIQFINTKKSIFNEDYGICLGNLILIEKYRIIFWITLLKMG